MNNLEKLNPLGKFCCSLGNLPTSYMISLSYEEQLLWLCNYLEKTVIPTLDNNVDVTNEVIQEIINLKEYIDNYFENLDVQEEINNKLDEMAETGDLQRIFEEYLNSSYIIQEITTETRFDETTNTHYFITHIPYQDSKGNVIKLKRGYSHDVPTYTDTESPRSFAKRHHATFCSNASIMGIDPQSEMYQKIPGVSILNGVIVANNPTTGYDERYHILGFDDENNLTVFPLNTSGETMLASGIKNTVTAFDQLITNGVITSNVIANDRKYAWNILGQNTLTKDIYFVCCNGKDINNEEGMTLPTLLNIMLTELGCNFAFRLDQGGSLEHVKNSVIINQITDNDGMTERGVPDFLYFSKEIETVTDNNFAENYNTLGDVEAKANFAKQNSIYQKEIIADIVKYNKPIDSEKIGHGFEFANSSGEKQISMTVTDINEIHPNSFNVYDNTQQKTIIRLDSILKSILLGDDTIFRAFEKIERISNENNSFDNIVNSSIVYVDFTDETIITPYDKPFFLLTLVIDNTANTSIQIAIPSTSSFGTGNYMPKIRYRSTSWGSWKSFSLS